MVSLEHFWNVVEHESVPITVGQPTTFATDALCDQNATNGWRPDHSSWVELDEFHVTKFCTRPQCQCMTVSGVFPRTRTNTPASSTSACSENNGLCRESMEVTIDTGVGNTASNTVAFFQEVANGILHEDVNTFVNTSFLERTDDFESSSVANVRKTWEGVATKVSLIDEMFLCSVKDSSPLFKFSNTVRCFLGMVFSHAPISEPLASFHGVMEVNFPTVTRICIL